MKQQPYARLGLESQNTIGSNQFKRFVLKLNSADSIHAVHHYWVSLKNAPENASKTTFLTLKIASERKISENIKACD